jgi:hypothetical protein
MPALPHARYLYAAKPASIPFGIGLFTLYYGIHLSTLFFVVSVIVFLLALRNYAKEHGNHEENKDGL